MNATAPSSPTGLSPAEIQRWTRVGLLSALAICLGYLETFIPIPIPGVKLGLANIAILVALAQRDIAGAWCIALVKVLAAGLLFGNPLTLAYSTAGTVLALAAMTPMSRIPGMHLAMTSVVGGILHETGQLAVAMLVLGTPLVWYSAPVLLAAGAASGLLCGIVAWRTAQLLETNGSVPGAAAQAKAPDDGGSSAPILPTSSAKTARHPKALLLAFLLYVVLFLHAGSPPSLAVGLAVAAGACIVARVQPRMVAKALRPVAFILVVTVIAQVANAQQGTAIAWLGPIAITQEALQQAGIAGARLLGIAAASVAVMSMVSPRQLLESVQWGLKPLGSMGLRTEGFSLALRVALQSVPVLASGIVSRSRALDVHPTRRAFWESTVPQFVADSYRAAYASCGLRV